MKTATIGACLLAGAFPWSAQAADFAAIAARVSHELQSAPAGLAAPLPDGLPVVGAVAGVARQDLIEPGYWEKLSPPAAPILAWLSARLPGLDAAMLRELPRAETLALIESARARQLSVLDVFTDAALREKKLYYLSRESLAEIDKNYELHSLFPIQGRTLDGRPYFLQAIVMGASKVEMLYNLNNFIFKHPTFTGHGGKFKFPSRVTQTITGPGLASLNNIRGPWNARIEKFVKLSPTRVRVVTSLSNEDSDLRPIRRK